MYGINVKNLQIRKGGLHIGEALKWGKILAEYKESKKKIKAYHESLNPEEDPSQEICLTISEDMFREISENLTQVKRRYLTELQHFLKHTGGAILTEKQFLIMSFRAKGCSMDEIAEKLGISKTAVYKSIQRSEKKIKAYFN